MNYHWRLRDIRPVRILATINLLNPYDALGPLSSALDTKHRYKAPQANRPGDRPYKRKKIK